QRATHKRTVHSVAHAMLAHYDKDPTVLSGRFGYPHRLGESERPGTLTGELLGDAWTIGGKRRDILAAKSLRDFVMPEYGLTGDLRRIGDHAREIPRADDVIDAAKFLDLLDRKVQSFHDLGRFLEPIEPAAERK